MNHLIAAMKIGTMVKLDPEHDKPANGRVSRLDMEAQKLRIDGDDRLFDFHSIEQVDGQYVFNRLYNRNSYIDEVRHVVEVANKQQIEGVVPDEEMLWSGLTFLNQMANS